MAPMLLNFSYFFINYFFIKIVKSANSALILGYLSTHFIGPKDLESDSFFM